MTCTHSHQRFIDGIWYCSDCSEVKSEKSRRGMTEWEKIKLGFYRDEKKWVDHIKSRKLVYDKQGRQHVIIPGKGEVPMQPKTLWPKPRMER